MAVGAANTPEMLNDLACSYATMLAQAVVGITVLNDWYVGASGGTAAATYGGSVTPQALVDVGMDSDDATSYSELLGGLNVIAAVLQGQQALAEAADLLGEVTPLIGPTVTPGFGASTTAV